MSRPSERIGWTVDVMDVRPDDRVLELGCGHGVAVDAIAEQLTTGVVVGIDKSEKMIDAARRRNARHIAAGRAEFHCTDLQSAPVEGLFEKVLAIHFPPLLNGEPKLELAFVRTHLATAGRIYIGCQPLSPGHGPTIIDNIIDGLHRNGFTTVDTATKYTDSGLLICVVGA